MKILVLMATYNGAKYLKEQIDSLINQEAVEINILVRDDGSSDETLNILNDYKKKGILEWYTGEHLNVQWGFYDLMKTAQCMDFEYFAFCDQDDVWDNDKLFIAISELSKIDRNIPALYYCGQRLVDSDLNFISDHELSKERSLQTRFVLSDFAGCTGVFNKRLLNEVLSYKPKYLLMHDTWILKICLCLGGKVIVDPKPHMNYRQHSGNSVGLRRSIRGYYKQVLQYINVYKVEEQMQELLKGFGDRMLPQYKEIAEWVCGYKTNKKYKRNLLDFKTVNFVSKGLNLTYWLKVNLKKL